MEKNTNQTAPPGSTQPELTARQEKLLTLLAASPNIQAASKTAGIGRSTAHRWLNDPVFRKELTIRRNTIMEETLGSLKSYTVKASEQLIKLLDSENEWVRRQTCKDILGYALKVREIENVEERLDVIEKALELRNPNQRRK